MKKALLQYMGGMVFLVILLFPELQMPLAGEFKKTAVENQESNQKILVEIFLSQEHKKDIDLIKNEFKRFSITKVRPQFFKLGNPPENIAIGRNVPVSAAQSAIQLALTYNQGIKFIIAEKRVAGDYLAIGTSMFDEKYQFAISPDDLQKLTDPSLTSPQFHEIYRHLTGDDKQP
jgi:hypothetical protein